MYDAEFISSAIHNWSAMQQIQIASFRQVTLSLNA